MTADPVPPDTTNSYLIAALDYAARGWPVLPLQPRDKAPNGLLVPHGLHDATTDPERIASWWRRVPDGNVGIRTGVGLDVIDLDSSAATRAFAEMAPEPVTPGVMVQTARGWHLWFASSDFPSRAAVIEGIDVRGRGGYVVAPPSVHPSGATYRLVDPSTGILLGRLPSAPLPAAPSWLVEWCQPPSPSPPDRSPGERPPIRLNPNHYARAAMESECLAVATTTEGGRNQRLNRASFSLGTLVGAGHLDPELARAHLLAAALQAGLGEREANRTITSGLVAGERQPRQRQERANTAREQNNVASKERSTNPPRRPAELTTKAVLDRARHNRSTSPVVFTPSPPSPRREIGR